MLSRPRKPPWKTLLPSTSLRLTHHVKFSSSLWKHALQERRVRLAGLARVDLVHPPRCPRVNRWVDVPEGPLIGRELAVGVHVPLAGHQPQLPLGELGVDHGQRNAVKRQVPGGVPRVLPGIGHRDHVEVVEVLPVAIAAEAPARGRLRPGRVASQPLPDVVVVELFGPEHPGEGLTLHGALVVAEVAVQDGLVELIRFASAQIEHLVEIDERRALPFAAQAKADRSCGSCGHREAMHGRGLGAGPLRVDGVGVAVDEGTMEGILDVHRVRRRP